MEIVLMRHGKPKIETRVRVCASEFTVFVGEYDAAGIDPAHEPPGTLIEQAGRCRFVLCSSLRRSRESALALGVTAIDACDPMFREMELPCADWRFPRLSAMAWIGIFRILWLFGYCPGSESFEEARQRARRCAERLTEYAAQHGSVLFVGHGALNWFIARDLKRMGWSGFGTSPQRHWGFDVFRYEASA